MEVGFWVGTKDVLELGAERVIKEAYDTGATKLSIFVVSNGKVYFNATERIYSDFKPIKGSDIDILKESLKYAKEYGIKITATIVCVVDPEHAKLFPEDCIVDFYGERHSYGICPTSPRLREYLANLAYDIASNYDVDEIELDYIRYKRSRVGKFLPFHLFLGRYCYCKRCMSLAKEFGINLEELNKVIDWFKKRVLTNTKNIEYLNYFINMGDITRFYSMNPIVAQWLHFRYNNVYKLVGFIKEKIKETGVKLSADLFYPTLSWQVGQNYILLTQHLDTVKPMIYTVRMGAWETKYLRQILEILGKEYEKLLLDFTSRLLGIERPRSLDEFEYKGAPSYVAYRETMKVKEMIMTGTKVYTGLYSSYIPGKIHNGPEVFREHLEQALKAKPDGVYFFSFRTTPKENREVIKEVL